MYRNQMIAPKLLPKQFFSLMLIKTNDNKTLWHMGYNRVVTVDSLKNVKKNSERYYYLRPFGNSD